MGDKPRLELAAGLFALFQSRDWSDLVIFSHDGSRYPVHRAIICPRSPFFDDAVRGRRWRDNAEGHLALIDDQEIVRLLVEYFYLLDYDASGTGQPPTELPTTSASSASVVTDDALSSRDSDTLSIRTEAGQYGHVYGSSAVAAFGGPHTLTANQHSPFSTAAFLRNRPDSSLTAHALPDHSGGSSGAPDFATFAQHGAVSIAPSSSGPRRRKTNRGMLVAKGPEASPLAGRAPHLLLHAKMYAAAERYQIGGLKALALDKFKIQLTRHWDSPELAEAIHIIFTDTPATDKEMREAVADTLEWHPNLLDKPEIETSIMEINGLAYELLRRSRRAEPEYD